MLVRRGADLRLSPAKSVGVSVSVGVGVGCFEVEKVEKVKRV